MDLLTYAVVSLENVKSFLGITNDSQNELLKLLINQSTEFIESATNRRIKETVHTYEKFDGNGEKEIQLKEYPIIIPPNVILQKNNAIDNSDDWETIDATDYFIDTDTGILRMNSKFCRGKNNYRATYTAGYSTVPYDLQYVSMSVISETLNRRKSMGISSERLGDHQISFVSAVESDPKLKNILDKYRKINL